MYQGWFQRLPPLAPSEYSSSSSVGLSKTSAGMYVRLITMPALFWRQLVRLRTLSHCPFSSVPKCQAMSQALRTSGSWHYSPGTIEGHPPLPCQTHLNAHVQSEAETSMAVKPDPVIQTPGNENKNKNENEKKVRDLLSLKKREKKKVHKKRRSCSHCYAVGKTCQAARICIPGTI